MIAFFHLSKGVLKILNYFGCKFFWQRDSEKRKYRLAKWSVVCRPKNQRGHGIRDLQVKNMALLGKWLVKLLSEEGVWQTLLKRKYIVSNALSQVYWKPGDSHFWVELMAIKKLFFPCGSFSLRDGSETRF
jgi:hypothetical protein